MLKFTGLVLIAAVIGAVIDVGLLWVGIKDPNFGYPAMLGAFLGYYMGEAEK